MAQIEPDTATITYMKSKEFGELVILHGMMEDKRVLQLDQCEGSYGYDPITFSILEPLKFEEGNKHPVAGRWSFRFKFKRCSTEKIYRLLLKAKPTGIPTNMGLPPGASRADYSLALTLKNVVGTQGLMLFGVPKECRALRIIDTRIVMSPTTLTVDGVNRDGVWEEEWTAHMCGVDFKAPLCLVPLPSGGTNYTGKPCQK